MIPSRSKRSFVEPLKNDLVPEGEALEDLSVDNFATYMKYKKIKLDKQFDQYAPPSRIGILNGVCIYITGYITVLPVTELNVLISQHGGRLDMYLSRRVTHVVAETMSDTKIRQMTETKFLRVPVISPLWILDSISQGNQIPIAPYIHPAFRIASRLKFANVSGALKSDDSDSETDVSDTDDKMIIHEEEWDEPEEDNIINGFVEEMKENVAEDDGLGEEKNLNYLEPVVDPSSTSSALPKSVSSNPSFRKSLSAYEKGFLQSFLNRSRLHLLGTYKKTSVSLVSKYLREIPAHSPPIFPEFKRKSTSPDSCYTGKQSQSSVPLLAHIDIDCFFAQIALMDHPHLVEKPVAVAHSSGKANSLPTPAETAALLQRHTWFIPGTSTSEISSCNYPARKFGIKAGMTVGKAKLMCPELIILPYNFTRIVEATERFFYLLVCLTRRVEPLSVDEAIVDLSDLEDPVAACHRFRMELKNPQILPCSDSIPSDANALAESASERLKKHEKRPISLTVSIGIGVSKLTARLATSKAKPDGLVVFPDDRYGSPIYELVQSPLHVSALKAIDPVVDFTVPLLSSGKDGGDCDQFSDSKFSSSHQIELNGSRFFYFLNTFKLNDFPGVGYMAWRKLRDSSLSSLSDIVDMNGLISRMSHTCNSNSHSHTILKRKKCLDYEPLRNRANSNKLESVLGVRAAANLVSYCCGLDDRSLEPVVDPLTSAFKRCVCKSESQASGSQQDCTCAPIVSVPQIGSDKKRQSVGVEVNYGIRFPNTLLGSATLFSFLAQITVEGFRRLLNAAREDAMLEPLEFKKDTKNASPSSNDDDDDIYGIPWPSDYTYVMNSANKLDTTSSVVGNSASETLTSVVVMNRETGQPFRLEDHMQKIRTSLQEEMKNLRNSCSTSNGANTYIDLFGLHYRPQVLTFKLMVRRPGEGESAKFLGMGIVDAKSKSTKLPFSDEDDGGIAPITSTLISTNTKRKGGSVNVVTLFEHVCQLLRDFNLPNEELRGIGLGFSKLLIPSKYLRNTDNYGVSSSILSAFSKKGNGKNVNVADSELKNGRIDTFLTPGRSAGSNVSSPRREVQNGDILKYTVSEGPTSAHEDDTVIVSVSNPPLNKPKGIETFLCSKVEAPMSQEDHSEKSKTSEASSGKRKKKKIDVFDMLVKASKEQAVARDTRAHELQSTSFRSFFDRSASSHHCTSSDDSSSARDDYLDLISDNEVEIIENPSQTSDTLTIPSKVSTTENVLDTTSSIEYIGVFSVGEFVSNSASSKAVSLPQNGDIYL